MICNILCNFPMVFCIDPFCTIELLNKHKITSNEFLLKVSILVYASGVVVHRLLSCLCFLASGMPVGYDISRYMVSRVTTIYTQRETSILNMVVSPTIEGGQICLNLIAILLRLSTLIGRVHLLHSGQHQCILPHPPPYMSLSASFSSFDLHADHANHSRSSTHEHI